MDINAFQFKIVKCIKIPTPALKLNLDNIVIGIGIVINVNSQIVVQNYPKP